MRFVFLLVIAASWLSLLAACGDARELEETPTASPAPRRSTTPRVASTTTPLIQKPDPHALLQPGYRLDQALEVNLDASEAGQIVAVSHTVRKIAETGEPAAAAVLPADQCPRDPTKEFEPTACLFRAEVFTFAPASGWTRSFVTPPPRGPLQEAEKGDTFGHRGGIQEVPQATGFAVDSERQALVLAFHYCTGVGSGCGDLHQVLAVRSGVIDVVYGAWKAQLTLGPTSATFRNPAYFGADPFCCPSGWQVETLSLDPATGDLGVIRSQLVVCTDGTLTSQALGTDAIALTCGPEAAIPGSIYRTTEETAVLPATIGGLSGLRDGDRAIVEYVVQPCPDGDIYCWSDNALVATKITVLNP